MRSIRWEVGTAIALVIAATACSSGSGSGNGGTGTGTCNNEQLGIAQLAGEGNACAQCLQNSCDSELQGYLSGCSDFLSCACAAGGNPSAIQGCASKEQESGCVSAGTTFYQCITTSCLNACSTRDGG
jgi:hypothetical protein